MENAIVGFAALFALLFLGLPLGFALALVGVAGFASIVAWGPALAMAGQVAVDTVLSYGFSVLPLFILMGAFLASSKLADDLYAACYAFLGHRRGGLALATILACAERLAGRRAVLLAARGAHLRPRRRARRLHRLQRRHQHAIVEPGGGPLGQYATGAAEKGHIHPASR